MVDPELPIIFTFVFTMVSLVFVMAQLFHRRAVRHEERKLELKARIEEAKAAQGNFQSEANELFEDRLRVLERIATDPSADLSRQIENLRDQQAERETAQ